MTHALVVGTGRMAGLRIPHLVDAGLELTITGRDVDRATEVAAHFGIGAIDIARAHRGNYDAVIVTSASADHEADLRSFADRAPVMFCEKPVATSSIVARDLQIVLANAGTRVYVGFQRRFDPAFVGARQAIAAGTLGQLFQVSGTDLDHTPSRPEFTAKSGGTFKDLLIHDIDCLLWTTGLHVRSLFAAGTAIADARYRELGDCDTVAVTLVLGEGTVAILRGSRVHPTGQDIRMEFLGSAGTLSAGLTRNTPLQSVEGGLPLHEEPVPQDFIERFQPAFSSETRQFASYLTGEAESFEGCTLEEAIRALEVAEACSRSWATQKLISFDA
jgi:myo-inositol 2-dehydrogenase/D-chiro-inositol 1-dehydrogenase